MVKLRSITIYFFDKIILNRPLLVMACLLLLVCFLGYHAKDFKLDASADTLLLEDDKDLHYSRIINSRYAEEDFLIITYAPEKDLFSEETLSELTDLRDELLRMKRVSSVSSILDAPLLESPPVPVKELANNIRTLESPATDKKLARIEFKNSPVYKNLLVSPDLKTTVLLVKFIVNIRQLDLLTHRNNLRQKKRSGHLTKKESVELRDVSDEFIKHRDKMRKIRHRDVAEIRSIMDRYREDARLYLGGINMIADDMVTFIKNDLKVFGLGVLFFLIITLTAIFKKPRWVLLPIFCCAFSIISMMGLLGIFNWEVTVVSSNFISLQLIITMAITIHLIVRYHELHHNNPQAEHRQLILDTVCFMFKPCLYASLTTIAGFASLLLCDILPVRTFGWMMIAGIIISLMFTFLFFPAEMMLLDKTKPVTKQKTQYSLTKNLAKLTESHGGMILIVSGIVFILSIVGVRKLEVENCFIDYFKETTEIYQGMKLIDQKLGGTTPLDVIVELKDPKILNIGPARIKAENGAENEFEEFEEFEDNQDEEKYWFTSGKMALVMKIHDYLDGLPETGKVLSLGTMLKLAQKLNEGEPLDNFKLALLYSNLPGKFRRMILKPYVSIEHDEVRFSVRVRDSEKSLRRNELLIKIRSDLTNKIGLKPEHVHLTGMLVLYNNILQGLFSSQILTLGVTILALICMFMLLFRSLKIALIATFPNLLSILAVLGFMGWAKIPLDMMTITIAAISIGIAVDDTIHYIHRFKREFQTDRNYINTLHRCHETIGHAMCYTSLTIIIGFSILSMSNFIPTVYFGLLTSLAMLIALIAALTLLPQFLITIKPFGPEDSAAA
jgi:predicted RND superfamily exporter protein